jgi:UDP-N-acetylglucosamine:LPS N-acetylglucosamine transferase
MRRNVTPEEPRSARVLILTASVGEGHDLPARTLGAQLALEAPDAEIVTADGLEPMGRFITAISADSGRIVFFRFQWLWDVGFWFFAEGRLTRWFTQAVLARVGGGGLLRLVEDVDPDIVVSTYPNTTEVLARLRLDGRIRVPVCSAITDLAALRYWASPGVDLHLIAYPQSLDEVRKIAGDATRVVSVHGLTSPGFLADQPQADARRALGLPPGGKIVLVSGGGWGVGDLGGAIDEALALDAVGLVICLCGRNEELRMRLEGRYGGVGRVRLEGFTDRMPVWMAAADVLVHSTGGLTVLEASMRGLPAISYGWGRGHIRLNNAAFERFELAEVVSDRHGLPAALRRALARNRLPAGAFAGLPSAASVVLDTAKRQSRNAQ